MAKEIINAKPTKVNIVLKDTMWSDFDPQNMTQPFQIFIYDIYYKLYENIERIKQLQFFSIQDFSEDINGNQWFTYKPKYNNCLATTETLQEFLQNTGIEYPADIIDLYDKTEDILASAEKLNDTKNMAGELWVRIKNFPFAYPISYNITADNTNIWTNVLNSEIIKHNIFEDFGYIIYRNQNITNVLFFKVNYLYNKESYIFSGNYLDRVDSELKIINKYTGEQKEELETIKKTIGISIIVNYQIPSFARIVDIINYNSDYYLIYADNMLSQLNALKIKKIKKDSAIIGDTLLNDYDSTITLPEQTLGSSTNILQPNIDTNWAVSISDKGINIAYEVENLY